MLSGSESETNDLHTLTINEHFAKAFEYKKEREELTKLKEKYGSDYSGSGSSDVDSDDSEDTEEDSDGEELTPAVDAAILRTLARIRKKEPAIYECGRRVFEEEHTRTRDKVPVTKRKAKEKSKQSLTIRQAALTSTLADADSHSRSPSPRPLTHIEEQALLQSETRAAFHSAVGSDVQGDDDDLLIPRSRTRDEVEVEEEEYKAFLEREVGEDLHNFVTVDTKEADGASEDVEMVGDGGRKSEGKKFKKGKRGREKEKEGVHAKEETQKRNKKSKEEADQEFLMNYIFDRGWIDRSNRRVPTYSEIVKSSSKQSKRGSTKPHVDSHADQSLDNEERELQGATLSDEDSFDDLADAFETSYNFRFEEPGGALIVTFPRDVASARRESTTRKEARTRKKEREKAEKHALLETRREEIRKERALVEAAVAEEDRDNDTLVIRQNTANKKKSKRQQKREELARLKSLKAKDLRRKLEMVSSEGGLSGIDEEALIHLILDTEWDPSKHDAQMAELYDGDDIVNGDAKKPIWDDDINIDDIEPPTNIKSKAELKRQKKKERKKKDKDADEGDGVDVDEMDANLDGAAVWDDEEEWRGTEEERKRKVDAYMDEVVNRLGFSGITSHMPTRFNYTSVPPENYGLGPTEILLATDAELNSYVGLKKLAPYRLEGGGKAKKNWDPKRAQRLKEFRENLHSRVGSQHEGPWLLGGNTNTESRTTDAQGEKKKRKGKKERGKLKAMQGGKDEEGGDGNGIVVAPDAADTPQKRKRDPVMSSHSSASLPAEAESDAEDGAPKKKRRRRHKGRSGVPLGRM